MESVVESHRQEAKRGGVPGNLSLVEAYLNIKKIRVIVQVSICFLFFFDVFST